MAKYSDIKGFTVQTLSTDPIESTPPTGAWSSGGNLNDGKPYGFKGGGVQTAAISFGAATSNDTANENYNGTSWSENSAMNDGFSYGTGTGSQTDAIAIGGVVNPGLNMKNQTEEWNGSSWTAGGNINTARYNVANQAWGPGTASAFVGGRGPDYQPKAFHEQYNGTAWTETTDMPTDIFDGSASGTQTNAILASGNHSKTPPGSSTQDGKTITWNGSAWTEISAFSTARTISSGSGPYNDFLLVGGNAPPGNLALTEKWNGSSWTEIADLSTARNSMGVSKTESDSTSAIVFGGSPSGSSAPTLTEEFSVAPPTASIITEGQLFFNSTTNTFKETISDVPNGTWATGGALNTARRLTSGSGTQTSSNCISGYSPSPNYMTQVENYDGTSWTEVAEVNTARYGTSAAGVDNTSSLVFGGYDGSNSAKTESWNGSAWTEVNDLNTARYLAGGNGVQTSALMYGGPSAVTETWDGTSWTEVSDLNEGRQGGAGVGPNSSSAQYTGGEDPSASQIVNSETWDGSTWTEVNNLNEGRQFLGGSGNASLGLVFGGDASPNTANTELWNGSSWTEINNLGTARTNVQGSGSAVAGLAAAGLVGTTVQSITEEFTAPLANKTITSS